MHLRFDKRSVNKVFHFSFHCCSSLCLFLPLLPFRQLFNFSGFLFFGALFAVCVAEIVFYLRLPALQHRQTERVGEREREGEVARIARQSQSQFPGATVAGCLFQVAPEQHNLQILTSKCRSGRSKLHGGTFFRCQCRVGR